ncbi:MAG: hypothetical protein HY704_01165 [Gemmatimonadetes bacterium]|nr:hypothetical protein [Gemmatimonadota bacterium]
MRPSLSAFWLAVGLRLVDGVGQPPLLHTQDRNDPEADRLVARWIQEAGGMDTYHRLEAATYTLTTEMYDPASGRLRYARPRYITIAKLAAGEASRLERWEGSDFIQQGFDGMRTWATMNGKLLPDTARDAREALLVARDVFYWFGLPFKLRDSGAFLRYRGRDTERRHRVAVEFGEDVGEHQDTWIYYFVDGRAWPAEVQYIEEGKTEVNRTRWEDIRTADGYPYAGRRVHLDDQGRVTKVIRTSDVRINPSIQPRLFSEP